MLRIGLACINQHGIIFSAENRPVAAKEASAAAAAEAALAERVSADTQIGSRGLWSFHLSVVCSVDAT
jgi:hypothetical protein